MLVLLRYPVIIFTIFLSQVSHLNLELVHSLRFVDSAFSSGESPSCGVSCVKFGMLSDDKDLTDLVNLVAKRGKEIEESQKVRSIIYLLILIRK